MGNKLTSIVKNSNISIIKTIGAALAAVTVAMISSHLAGYVNSLVLVGAASVITALASEVYRMILSATTKTVAATARRTAQVIKDQPQDLEDTQEIPTVGDSNNLGDTDTTSNETTILDAITLKEATNPTPRASQDITKEIPASEKTAAALVSKMSTWVTRANPKTVKTCFRWAIMFLSMTLIAVGASYLMGGKDTERIVYRDVVRDAPTSAAPGTLSSTMENTQGATSSGTPSAGGSQDNATPPSRNEQAAPTTEPDSGSNSITQQGTQEKENPHPGDSNSNSGANSQKQAPNTYTQQNQEQANPDSQASRDGTSQQDNHKKQEDDNQESQANQDAGSGDQNPVNQAGQGTEEVNNNTGD